MRVDPRIYDAPEFTGPEVAGTAPAVPYEAPQAVSQSEVLAGTQSEMIGQNINVTATRERASSLASLGAAMSEWSIRHAYDYFSGPTFEADPNWSAGEVLPHMQQTLNKDERTFLMQSRSAKEFDYRRQALERQRAAQLAMADHPAISFMGMMIDPGYLAIDVASLGAGRLAAAARATRSVQAVSTAGVAGAGAYALGRVEQQAVPMSDADVVVGAMLNGAAAGVFYSAGKLQRVDPEYPSEVLNNIATATRSSNPDKGLDIPHEFRAPEGQMRTGRELGEHLAELYKGHELEPVVQAILRDADLDGVRVSTGATAQSVSPKSRGFYDPNQRLVFVRENEGRDVALHELLHATVEKRLTRHPEIGKELASMAAEVRRSLANQGGGDAGAFWANQFKKPAEFVAYALSSPAFRKWAQNAELGASGAPRSAGLDLGPAAAVAQPKLTVWDRFIDAIQRMLGLEGRAAQAFKKYQTDLNLAQQASNREFRSLDDRLFSMLRETEGTSGSMYTSGLLRGIDNNLSSAQIATRIDNSVGRQVGNRISWSLHKSLASHGQTAREIADVLVDNPLDMTGDSVVSQARAVRADLAGLQFQYEDLLKAELANRGASLFNRIVRPREALDIQRGLEREVATELLARERSTRLGLKTSTNTTPEVKALADSLDRLYSAALREMQAAGVAGADAVAESSGYFSRKWDVAHIEDAEARMVRNGYTPEEAARTIDRIVSQGLRRANGWDADLSRTVGRAIIDRARRKGYFEDSAFRAHSGNAAAAEIRDILRGQLSEDQINRVMGVVTGVNDEAGKLSALKHRIDIDMKAGINLPDGSVVTVADLINTDLTRMTESYLDQVSGRIAMARKDMPDISDIDALRTRLSRSIPQQGERAEAIKMFDSTVDAIMGRPTGEDMNEFMRNMQSVTRMVGLASSGLWQLTEYATAMARFGALRTLRSIMRETTFSNLRSDVRKSRRVSSDLKEILARNAAQDVRIRPFVNRLEDNFEVPASSIVQSALLQAQQMVPYVNAQKLVQTHQARVVSNLVVDTFRQAAEGNQAARRALAEYGLESHVLDNHAAALRSAGMDTTQWPDGVWQAVRGPLTKMMDDAVLRNRTGEIPAFAQFSQVGKFIFTFRSFVLGAHNKVLAGTVSRDGLSGISLLMLYQYPMVLLATEANSIIQGKPLTDEELVKRAFGQMGSLGLFSEIFGVVSGEKQQFGAPGLIAIDRLYKLAGDVSSLDPGQAASGAIQAMPILSIIPGSRALGEALKE